MFYQNAQKTEPITVYWPFYYVECSQNEKYIAIATPRTVKIWNIEDFKEVPQGTLFENDFKKDICFLKFSPDDADRLLVCDRNNGVSVWDINEFREISNDYILNEHMVQYFQYSPQGRYIITVSGDNSAEVWDAVTFQLIPGGGLKGYAPSAGDVNICPDGRYMIEYYKYSGNPRIIWDLSSFKTLPLTHPELEKVRSWRYNKNGDYFVTTSRDDFATVWDAKTMRKIPGGTLNGHTDIIWYADFSQDEEGRYIVTSSRDGTSKVWNAKTFMEVPGGTLKERGDGGAPAFAQFSPDGKTLITTDQIGSITVWSTDGFKKLSVHNRFKEEFYFVQYTSKGILTDTPSKSSFELRDTKTFCEIQGRSISGAQTVNFSEDEKYIVIVLQLRLLMLKLSKRYQIIIG